MSGKDFRFFDVGSQCLSDLPGDWQQQMIELALNEATTVVLKGNNVTSRELANGNDIYSRVVGGLVVKHNLPWLYDAYHGLFREHGSLVSGRLLVPAENDESGVVLNVMTPDVGRYDVHVDSNPMQGMFYACNGSGGELVVAHNLSARGVDQIESDAIVITPKPGSLLFFDGRRPHYVRAVSSGMRVAAAMNYYDSGSTETHRPSDLTDYLNARPGE